MKDANHDGSGNPYPDNSWEHRQELGGKLNDALAEIERLSTEGRAKDVRIGKLLTVLYAANAFMQQPTENHKETLREAIDICGLKHLNPDKGRYNALDDLVESGGLPEAQALSTASTGQPDE